jgi:flap endonuclease-1
MASSRLTDDMIGEAKTLLDCMGVGWVQAPSEGEAQAVHLLQEGKAWAVGSQDWDALLFGAGRLVRNLTVSERKKVPRKEKYITVKPELVELRNVLSALAITQEQLICLGILIGTDYNPGGVKGIGPKTALKVVREKKSPDRIFSSVRWDFAILPEAIFDFFTNPPAEDAEVRKKELDQDKLLAFMQDHDFSGERVESALRKMAEKSPEKDQSRLSRFFGR